MKDKNYYEILFKNYAAEVTLPEFREMLGGLSENAARDWIKKGKVKSCLVESETKCRKNTVTVINLTISKESIINYLVKKSNFESLNSYFYQSEQPLFLETMKEFYCNHFKNYPDKLTLKQARKMLGVSIDVVRKLISNGEIQSSSERILMTINKDYSSTCKRYMISKQSIIDYVTSEEYQKNSIKRKANI